MQEFSDNLLGTNSMIPESFWKPIHARRWPLDRVQTHAGRRSLDRLQA